MCGIAGIWQLNGQAVNDTGLRVFTDRLAHRGPDGAGYQLFDDNTLGLGHRRLSILDLSDAGHQPMSDAESRFYITYNGEVFNFIEIRETLVSLGYVFHTETDTEVILAAYAQWGPLCLERFNGMWAMAIWDNRNKELFLARDRFGIKPLYYVHKPGEWLAFASETNAFTSLQNYSREIDPDLLAIQIKDNYALPAQGYTIFKDLFQILPGHYVLLKKYDAFSQKRWYDIREQLKKPSDNYNEQVSVFLSLFEDSLTLRLRSDVAIGTALSGGLDSSSVYATLNKIKKENKELRRLPADWNRAFVQTFPGSESDETEYALKVSEHCGGEAVLLKHSKSDLGEDLKKSALHADTVSIQPLLSISNIYRGMREQGIKVSLDGHGVDEMMYGYVDSVYREYEYSKWNGTEREAFDILEVLKGLYHPRHVESGKMALLEDAREVFNIRKTWKHRIGKQIRRWLPRRGKKQDALPFLSDKPYQFDQASSHLEYEFFQHTLPALLISFDKAAMMHGVEIRMPFMDYRLVEHVFSLPKSSKLGGGFTKRLLRDAMRHILPEDIRTRTFKVGIGAPLSDWLNGSLSTWAAEMMDKVVESKIYSPHVMAELREAIRKQTVSSGQSHQIWNAISCHLIGEQTDGKMEQPVDAVTRTV